MKFLQSEIDSETNGLKKGAGLCCV